MGVTDHERFLTRWARLKQQSGKAPRSGQAYSADGARECPASGPATSAAPERGAADPAPASQTDFADVDFDALDANSDYTRFMQPGVPEAIRQKALRRLWACDPVLATPDGLDAYTGDYTDTATVARASLLTSAYRMGRGFLDESEAAAWEQLGRSATDLGAGSDAGPSDASSAGSPLERGADDVDPSLRPAVPEEKAATASIEAAVELSPDLED